ncbi:unnamed protein product, partial [Musa textilis]
VAVGNDSDSESGDSGNGSGSSEQRERRARLGLGKTREKCALVGSIEPTKADRTSILMLV